METIAKDYPELYTNKNNKYRTLDKELAIKRNDKLIEAYNKVNKRVIIGCYENIEIKYDEVIKEIENILN